MYLGKMTCSIKLADKYILPGANSIEIKKSVHQIVQTAKVLIPLSMVMQNNQVVERIKITDKIKEGDKITISFGYNGFNKVEFIGYIKRINQKQPLELECEDEMYLLRRVKMKKSFKKNDIREVLQYVMDETHKQFGIGFKLYDNIPKITVTNLLINGGNGIEVLQELFDKYLTTTYLTTYKGDKILYAGLTYGLKKARVKHVLTRNTINIDSLKYQQAADMAYKCEVTNFRDDGTVRKVTFGDKNGQELKVYAMHTKTDKELEHVAMAEIAKFQNTSYKGSFTTFPFPYCEPGDISDMTDPQFADRKGSYYIGTVTTTFNGSGGRLKPEIDIRVA